MFALCVAIAAACRDGWANKRQEVKAARKSIRFTAVVLLPRPWTTKLQGIKHDFVDIAPAPLFAGLQRLDDRVTYSMKMLRGVLVG